MNEAWTKLVEGWKPPRCRALDEFVEHWRERLRTPTDIEATGINTLRFVSDLSDIRLRGLGHVNCLLVTGTGPSVAAAVKEFWQDAGGRGTLLFVLTLTGEGFECAQAVLPHGSALVLRPTDVQAILRAEQPRQLLKRCLWAQIPKIRLVPFSILLPAEGAMFVGRHHELDRLRHQEQTSFAVPGPSRIGKTSLIKKYRELLVRERDPWAQATHYISFYGCLDKSADGVARWLATRIHASSRAHRMTAGSLFGFLRYHRGLAGRPLNLLIDEVDQVCGGEAFNLLAAAVREGDCRVVLCGRANLLWTLTHSTSYLANRLEVIRLQPLDAGTAQDFLRATFADLGLQLAQPEAVFQRIGRLTGRLPHLLQFYGEQLTVRAVGAQSEVLSMEQVEAVANELETARYFLSALKDVADPTLRVLALLLLRDNPDRITPCQVQQLAQRQGLPLDHEQAVDCCDRLVIHNILAWDSPGYALANGSLADYAQQFGYLDAGLQDALRRVQVPTPPVRQSFSLA